MTFRGQYIPRCETCRLESVRCMCSVIPKLEARTRVVVFMHVRESVRPSNTGRFLPWMLPNASMVIRSIPFAEPEPLPPLGDGPRFLLHPGATHELSAEDAAKDPVLFVPDGTWAESRRMIHRDPDLSTAIRVKLPPGPSGSYALRTSPHPDQLSTLEAVARAIGVLEGEHVAAPMLKVFDEFVFRTLLTRGKLRDDPVLGVVPAGTPRIRWPKGEAARSEAEFREESGESEG